jgi:hypothetical protein
MAAIAIGVVFMSCICSAVGGGGYFFMQAEQERKRIKDIEDNVGNAAALVIYPECDYKGEPMTWQVEPDTVNANIEMGALVPPGKSFVLPSGYKIDAYSKNSKEGVKLPFKGPMFQRCTTIKSLSGEWGTPPPGTITTDTGDCDPSRPGGCEITI